MSIALDARHVPDDPEGAELRCPACDYDLRALAGERCPECGLLIDRAALAQSQIPWAHRDRIGSIRAYQRTAWLAWRHPKRLAMSVASPVDLHDARAFQRITVVLAFVPAVVIGIAYIIYYEGGTRTRLVRRLSHAVESVFRSAARDANAALQCHEAL